MFRNLIALGGEEGLGDILIEYFSFTGTCPFYA
jgi:hypothetical protein